MKTVPSSMKERKRYILIKLYGKVERKKEIFEGVAKAISQFLGELTMAKAGVQFLHETWNNDKQTMIARVDNKYLNEFRSALALIKEVNNKKLTFSTVKVSGNINKLK